MDHGYSSSGSWPINMFEEIFHRNKQTKVREVPKEVDAVQRKASTRGNSKATKSSVSIDAYLLMKNTALAVIVLVGFGIITLFGYSLISDFVIHSSGETSISMDPNVKVAGIPGNAAAESGIDPR